MPRSSGRSPLQLLRFLVTLSMFAGGLLTWPLGPPGPAHADHPEASDHRDEQPWLPPGTVTGTPIVRDHRGEGDALARLQLVLKKVHIRSDHDPIFGAGEFKMDLSLRRCEAATAEACRTSSRFGEAVDEQIKYFSADSGDDVRLDRTVTLNAFPGERYRIKVEMWERDCFGNCGTVGTSDDSMGTISWVLGEENGWRLGTHSIRSFKEEALALGDYDLEVEVRHAPFSDIRPVGITVNDLPSGTAKLVCMAFENVEPVDAGPFEVALRVDGVVPSGARTTAQRLPGETSAEQCVEAALSASEQHQLAVVVDEPRTLIEVNEVNNVYEQPYPRTLVIGSNEYASAERPVIVGSNVFSSSQGGTPTEPSPTATPTSTPTATPSPARPDLAVSAIKVRGRVPDGKDDCKDGKNDITVVVKNGGTAAGAFVVQLEVDGETTVKQVPDLAADQEREVRFDDVRLRKGDRKLTATADAQKTVAESDEGNNALSVSARCKDDD